MRLSVLILVTTLTLSGSLASGPAAAFGLSFEFPTLSWPVAAPTPAPVQPAVDCTDPANAVLCPAPSR